MQFSNEDSDNNEYIDLDVLNRDIILRNINFTYDRNTILHDFFVDLRAESAIC